MATFHENLITTFANFKSKHIDQINSNLAYLTETGVKNVLPFKYFSSPSDLWIVNSDGTITLNGSTLDSANFNLAHPSEKYAPPKGTYKWSKHNTNVYAVIQAYNGSNTFVKNLVNTDSEDVEFTIDYVGYDRLNIYLHIAANTTWNNVILYPMIRPSQSDSEYQSPAQTNAALTKRAVLTHNIPRLVPKDITSYITDGTLWQRLNGTNGFELFEDIYCGDYIHMSRAISAYELTQTYQVTGSDYVTIAEIDGKMGDGDSSQVTYHHLVMVAGKGFGGTQHFGRSRMNPTNTTVGGYVGSEMSTTTIGAVASSGSTALEATINQQLYAEFGSHLKTIRQILTNSINETGYNRFGTNSGCANNWEWTSVQAFLMSEIEVYGSVVWGSSGYDVGNGNHQFALFRHSKEAMNNRTAYYWLKDVATAAYFAWFNDGGYAHYSVASNANRYVRPCFVIA